MPFHDQEFSYKEVNKIALSFLLIAMLIFPKPAGAVVIAQQTQNWSSSLQVWQMIQELGDSLTGTADKFTFRVSTAKTNLDQFDYTSINTRIYDKSNNNSYIIACVPPDSNPNDRLRGISFTTTNVPAGFEDVTLDFACRNYTFIPGHKYLIRITNANMTSIIFFAGATYPGGGSDLFTPGGLRYANGNKWDYSNGSGYCNPVAYTWGSTNPYHNGCYVWVTPKDDLYFILSNNSPPPKTPVIFIPGIGGSEMQATQDIVWSRDDGHGGTFSHAYGANEKIWVNQDQAAALGDDDYFDVLKLKTDGVTPEAPLSLTGNLTSFGYGDIDSFFSGMGYVKGTNFFVFPYDWRKDIRTTQTDLDSLIETAKQKTGLSKVNIVAHSMGGLVAHTYISDPGKAAKVNKFIGLGIPHLGVPSATKTLMYGSALQKNVFGIFPIGIPASEVKDVSQNNPGLFQLLPSSQYFNFYDNSSSDQLYPFKDDRDIDSNNIKGALNFEQLKSLITNLSYNMAVFDLAEQFHNLIDPLLNQANGVKLYEIVGSAQPTLGQIRETWWITWPVNLIPKTDEVFINGDDTVPLYSASLKSSSLDLSAGGKIYYVDQKHSDLVSQNGSAMQTVKKILEDDDNVPVDVKSDKYTLDGKHISADQDVDLDLYDDQNRHCGQNDQGEIEENIPHVTCTSSVKTRHAFVKKKAGKVKVKVKSGSKKTSTIRIRHYQSDSVIKTTTYQDVPIDTTPIIFEVDPTSDTPPVITADNNNITPSDISGSNALDQTTPATSIETSGTEDSSGIYTDPVTITLTGTDSGSGILNIEYTLDNGQTVDTYNGPFTVSTPGQTTIQYSATDQIGNQEIPQSLTIEIAASPSPSPSPTPTPTPTPASTTTTADTPKVGPDSFGVDQSDILGVAFENPSHIADQITVTGILEKQEIPARETGKITNNTVNQTLSGLLMITGGAAALALVGLIATFRRHISLLKPFPK